MKSDEALRMVALEVERVSKEHDPYRSSHEGYAVILEEMDELWDEVKKRAGARSAIALRKEATHVAATAVRFLMSCCDEA